MKKRLVVEAETVRSLVVALSQAELRDLQGEVSGTSDASTATTQHLEATHGMQLKTI